MKRMCDVFNLPLNYADAVEMMATHLNNDEVKSVQSAINHIEALADALGVLLNDACDNGMHNRKSVCIAAKALAAYRGDK